MTVNMNGHTNVREQERRDLLSKIIRRKDKGSSLVFCQELPGRFESDVVPDDYDFVRTADKNAAVMWSKQHFHSKKVDAGFKTKIFDKLPDTMKKIDDDDDILSKIPGRTAVVKLTVIKESCNFLAASWHGPHSGKKLEIKKKALKGLILFLHEVCRRMKDVSSIIIGGDFNLNTLAENGLDELNVYFPCYVLSDRATERLKDRKNYIPYKDNFAITTTSPPVVSPFGVMNLSEVKPLLEFVYVKEDGSDILDHDPITGFLQLGKTPSIGKFWLVRQRFTWPLAKKPCLKRIVTFSMLLEISRCLVESVVE